MSSKLSTTQNVKQGTRQMMVKASDKMKLATTAVARGDTRELDVAIIKSTTPQFHVPPKEKHVRTLKGIVQSGNKENVKEVVKQLILRLKGATDWLTALKALMTIHRLMRECDSTFLNGMVQYGNTASSKQRGGGQLLDMGNFLDTTNIDHRFDYSEWVRAYGKYLDEQLEVYRELTFYPEMEHGGESSRMRTLSGEQLLKQLPVLQRLQQRLMDCKPGGAAAHDPVVQTALLAVLKESFKVYKAISEGIINLADRFFEMEYLEAQKGLEIYKESIVDNSRLQEYYKQVEDIEELRRAVQFPKLENLPSDFLTQMEGYVKEAPRKMDQTGQEVAVRKKHTPLRKGSRAPPGQAGPRFENASSGLSATSPRDPGMIGTFSKAESEAAAPSVGEPNLLDLDEVDLAEPSPATNGTPGSMANGFGESQPSPAGPTDPFGGAASSSFASVPATNTQPHPPSQQNPNPYAQPAASSSFNRYSSQPLPAQGSNPFGGPGGFPAAPSSFSPAPSPPSYGQGFNSSTAQFPAAPLTSQSPASQGFQPTSQGFQPASQGYQPAPYGFQSASQGFQPKGGAPMAAGSHQFSGYGSGPAQNQSYPQSHPPPSPGNYGMAAGAGGGYGSGYLRGNDAQNSQIEQFGGESRGAAPATPSKPPPSSIAAGLTRPTNVVLAKEAALHDPFASLAFIDKPTPAVKSSPPLKSKSPGSAISGGQASGQPSPVQPQTQFPQQQQQSQQTQFEPANFGSQQLGGGGFRSQGAGGNGFQSQAAGGNGFQSQAFGGDSQGWGPTAFPPVPPQTQASQQQPQSSQAVAAPPSLPVDSNSLI